MPIHRATRLAAAAACSAAPILPAIADTHLIFTPGEGPFSWGSYQAFADAHDFPGERLEILGTSTGEDKRKLDRLYAYFAEATGAEVMLSGSDSFEQDVVISAQAGTLPDIASFPQPGLARDLAGQGTLVPEPPEMRQWFIDNYAAGESWADLATLDGPAGADNIYGIFFGTDVKSLVWYVPENFAEFGYDIPETMEELKALTRRIAEDGATPWCIGLGSGAATGWPATDWVEDLMLRTQPPAVYDRWVSNELPFDDPAVVGAIEEYGWFARNEDFVAGGPEAVATTDFRDSPDGLFGFPPDCLMHKQASFIPTFFPENVTVGEDVDFFYFPAYRDADLGKPILGSGGLVARFNDRPVTRGFIEFLKTPFAHEVAIAQEQFLTPHLAANPDAYASPTQRALGDILTSATTFRFDGSDLMPAEIGTDAFWSAMVDYTTGADAGEVAADVQDRWDAIR